MTQTGRSSEADGPAALPTGLVTFLFTDIEGSTRRWEAHGAAMDRAVKQHDAILRSSIESHRGHIFKTVGDAFCCAFSIPSDAVQASIVAQRALNQEDFSAVGGLLVRMSLHTGEATERDGDYFGPAVNRVARLTSIGHGGQVLLSDATRAVVRGDLPAGVSLTDFGLRRLKDLTQPEHVWQLTIEGLPSLFPTLNSLDARPNNLPLQSTNFRGRENDLQEIEQLLSQTRLLSLIGTGGIGKTRLALQAGADLLDQFADGVWFVEFADIVEPALVAESIAVAVGAKTAANRDAINVLTEHLKRKQLLLILDNCEHVVEPVAALSKTILERCSGVRLLATSRQALGVSGEIAHRVASLSFPDKSKTLTAAEAMRFGAIALFADRAQAVNTRFALTDKNAAIVADICRRLDGIALAIELAAARMKVLSASSLASMLDDRLRVLTGGARTAMPRQKTLRALIDWSHDLLSVPEQTFFRRLAVFAGDFSLDAAAAVCAGDDVDESDALNLVSSLVDKSLLVPELAGDVERFRLLESTREYALEKLRESGEHDRLTRAHATHYATVAFILDTAKGSARETARVLEPDADNYRAVLSWALEQGNDVALGRRLAGALGYLWSAGLRVEGLRWAKTALESLGESPPDDVAARLWLIVAEVSDGMSSRDAAERAAVLFDRVANDHRLSTALYYLGFASYQVGKYEEAESSYRRALSIARETGDQPGVARSLNGLASALFVRGDVEGPRRCYAEALALHTAAKNEAGCAAVLGNLAELEFAEGNVEQALVHGLDALALDLKGTNEAIKAVGYASVSAYRICLGKLDDAKSDALESLRRARDAQGDMQIAIAMQNLALISALSHNPDRAAKLLGYVDRAYHESGIEREPTEAWTYRKLFASLLDQLPKDDVANLIAEGCAWSDDRAIDEAFAL